MKSPWIEGKLSKEEIRAIWDMEAKEAEAANKKREKRERSKDPFFLDDSVYDGPVPSDLSLRHDDYLYGGES